MAVVVASVVLLLNTSGSARGRDGRANCAREQTASGERADGRRRQRGLRGGAAGDAPALLEPAGTARTMSAWAVVSARACVGVVTAAVYTA